MMTLIFVVGRLLLGGYFLMNAWNHFSGVKHMKGYAQSKGVPAPEVAIIGSGILLLLGGLGILLWFYVKLACLLLAVFLIGVTFMMHQYGKVTDPMQRMGERINFTKNLALLGSLLILFVFA